MATFLNNCTMIRLIGNTIKLDWIPTMNWCHVNVKKPASMMTLFWALTGASYHMTFTSMVHINRDRQHVTRCARVNRLRAGRNAIENHKWLSDKSRVVLVRNKCTKSPSSSFPATGTRRSTWPSPSSHASQRSHRKKNFSFVWMSRTAIWERCQDALLPLLSCQTRM